MKTRWLIIGLVLAAVVAVVLVRSGRPDSSAAEAGTGTQAADPAKQGTPLPSLGAPAATTPRGPVEHTTGDRKPYDTGIPDDPRVRHTETGRHVFIESIGVARAMAGPEDETEQDLERVETILSFYRMAFDENPVAADNASVMAALMGENPKSLVFFPEDHPSLNAQGELTDRWGTPYYFHALSGTKMEIVSPGPDRKLGNADDLIHTQRNPDDFFRGYTEPPPEPDEE